MKAFLDKILLALSILLLAFSLAAFWMYGAFYLRWADKFNAEGRYFDPKEGVVYLGQDRWYLAFAVAALVLSLVCGWVRRRFRDPRARRGV